MYQLSIFNNGVETVVHYPSSNQDDPHVIKLPLKEGLSIVDSLSFSLYPNNQGYNNVFELVTRVKVFDLRDNTIRFSGRILDVNNKMDSSGKVYKEVTCEGALSYLNDTKQRGSSFVAENVTSFLSQILGVHNSKVEPSKQIQIGYVNVGGNVIHSCNYKTTLAEILEVREVNGGDIRVRDSNGTLYLDWLTSFSDNTLEVSLGVNMKDMIVSKDVTSLGTRIVPLGANNLTIEAVNNGLDYIDDQNAKNKYGTIEKTVEYREIEDAATLFNTCVTDMPKHTQPSYVLESNALDLSYLTGNKVEQFVLGVNTHLINQFMGVDSLYKVVALDLDLLTPYNPTLTIANKPLTLTNTINDLRKTSLQEGGVYNNVQIGRAFGIRVVRSDNKAITTMNATEGISIENQNKKVLYLDMNGNIVCNDITANNMKAKGGTFDDITSRRGTFDDMTVNRGTFKDIKATGGEFDDITATNGLTITDGDSTCKVNAAGITLTDGDYTSTMTVSQSDADGTNITFDNGVVVSDDFVVKGSAYFDGNLVMIGADSIKDYIDDRIKATVKTESLK